VGEGAFASLWDVATGKEMGRFGKRWEEVSYTVAISPDGQTLACGGRDYVVHLWDVATGKERGRLIGHEGIIGHFVFAPDGRLLASAGDDKTVRLWDPATCTEVRRLPPCPAPVVSVAFSRDGKKLAAGCRGGSVFVWEVATGKELVAINPTERKDDFLNRVAFSPDGATVVAGGTGILWDAATGKEKGRLQDHDSWVRAIAFSPDGAKVAADDSTRVRFWDAATGKSVPADEGHQAAVWTASFFPDGRTLASGARDATVRLWDSGTGKLLRTLAGRFDTDEHVSQLAVSRDGTIVAARLGRTLYAWEAATGKELFAVTRPGDWIRSLAFAPDGKTLATGSGIDDKLIRFWEARTGAELRSFGDQRGGMSALAFSPDGRWLVSVGGDAEAGSVYVWEAATGKQLHSLRVRRAGVTPIVGLPPPHVTSAAFAPRGDLLATGGWGMQVRLWDPATGKELMQLKTENGDVAAVAFSPDGQMLATVGDTGSVELWETATGQRRQAWAAHPGRCEAVAFAPDGRRLATAGFDTTVLIWDPAGLRTRTAGKLAQKLSGKDLEQLWTELASPDAARAYTAMCTLAAAPFESVAFLKDRLPPAAEVKRERVRALIADLASDQFLVRQAAYGELKDLSEKAVDGLREALRGNPPLEVSRRVESLLELARVLQPETLRRLRAVEVLGGIDSEGSRGILENLARGCPAARETQNARAALERRRTRVP
jgi:WD40 repeat protein